MTTDVHELNQDGDGKGHKLSSDGDEDLRAAVVLLDSCNQLLKHEVIQPCPD